jgi:hypothetical protein
VPAELPATAYASISPHKKISVETGPNFVKSVPNSGVICPIPTLASKPNCLSRSGLENERRLTGTKTSIHCGHFGVLGLNPPLPPLGATSLPAETDFLQYKRMVHDLLDHLNAQGDSADRKHCDMSQALGDRVMHKFRRSDIEFPVATDVAVRGSDVHDVQVVFSYDLPYDAEDYLKHRKANGAKPDHGPIFVFRGSFASGTASGINPADTTR